MADNEDTYSSNNITVTTTTDGTGVNSDGYSVALYAAPPIEDSLPSDFYIPFEGNYENRIARLEELLGNAPPQDWSDLAKQVFEAAQMIAVGKFGDALDTLLDCYPALRELIEQKVKERLSK